MIDAKYVSDKKAFLVDNSAPDVFLFICTNCHQQNQDGRFPKRINIYPVQDSDIEDPFELEETLFGPKTLILSTYSKNYILARQQPNSHHYGCLLSLYPALRVLMHSLIPSFMMEIAEYFERKFPTLGETIEIKVITEESTINIVRAILGIEDPFQFSGERQADTSE